MLQKVILTFFETLKFEISLSNYREKEPMKICGKHKDTKKWNILQETPLWSTSNIYFFNKLYSISFKCTLQSQKCFLNVWILTK